MENKFEELPKIKMLRQLLSIDVDGRDEWKVERTVIADLHKKILWARYGYEQGMIQIKNKTEGKE